MANEQEIAVAVATAIIKEQNEFWLWFCIWGIIICGLYLVFDEIGNIISARAVKNYKPSPKLQEAYDRLDEWIAQPPEYHKKQHAEFQESLKRDNAPIDKDDKIG